MTGARELSLACEALPVVRSSHVERTEDGCETRATHSKVAVSFASDAVAAEVGVNILRRRPGTDCIDSLV